uniref:U13-hexatoxin-Hi1a n=1 Tax=Hadronyche infensa TaxID=153481 RepID=TD1A_HADIN
MEMSLRVALFFAFWVCLTTGSLNEICYQEKVVGNCGSQLYPYYFNSQSGKCERFMYTGCGKNDNNFGYLFECERTCPGDLDLGDVCSLEPEGGHCRAYFIKYFFNATSGMCEKFVYGGCGGNV